MNTQILDLLTYGIAISAICLVAAVKFNSGVERTLAIYLLKRYRIEKACEAYRKLYVAQLVEDHLFNPDRHPMAVLPEPEPEPGKGKGNVNDTNCRPIGSGTHAEAAGN